MSRAKFEDWEYMLKSAIYLSLIGYNDSNGHTIPCKTRGEMEDAILARFTQSMKQDKYDPPQPQQKEQFSREDMLKVIKIAYDNGESNATRQYGDGWDTSNPEKLLTEYLNSKK